MNQHHTYLLEQFQAKQGDRSTQGQRPEHDELGVDRIWYGIRNPVRREIMLNWINNHKDISYDDWLALCDSLYNGDSYEERCAPQTLLSKYPKYRRQLPLSQLDHWLGQLEGWAEVDSTCQSVFTHKDLLADWENWQPFLDALSQDDNINKRRASLVLLVRPMSKTDDMRLRQQTFANIDRLKHESHKLITKAVSWLLRESIRHHRSTVEHYLEDNQESLPAIAIRETRKKLETGTK